MATLVHNQRRRARLAVVFERLLGFLEPDIVSFTADVQRRHRDFAPRQRAGVHFQLGQMRAAKQNGELEQGVWRGVGVILGMLQHQGETHDCALREADGAVEGSPFLDLLLKIVERLEQLARVKRDRRRRVVEVPVARLVVEGRYGLVCRRRDLAVDEGERAVVLLLESGDISDCVLRVRHT